MKKADFDIPRVDLYRKTIVFNNKYQNLQRSLKDHKNQNDQYL